MREAGRDVSQQRPTAGQGLCPPPPRPAGTRRCRLLAPACTLQERAAAWTRPSIPQAGRPGPMGVTIPCRPFMSTDRRLGRTPRSPQAGEPGPLGIAIPCRPTLSTDHRVDGSPRARTGSPAQLAVGAQGGPAGDSSSQRPGCTSMRGQGVLPGGGRCSRRVCGGQQPLTARALHLVGTGSPGQAAVGAQGGPAGDEPPPPPAPCQEASALHMARPTSTGGFPPA